MSMDATGVMENIQIAGTIWGMTRAQIRNKHRRYRRSEFTELGDFLKVPVRTYSNGMLLRLAFAIATIRDPEILLIDEAIGVSDLRLLQESCFFARLLAARRALAHSDCRVASGDEIAAPLCATRRPGSVTGNLMAFGRIRERHQPLIAIRMRWRSRRLRLERQLAPGTPAAWLCARNCPQQNRIAGDGADRRLDTGASHRYVVDGAPKRRETS